VAPHIAAISPLQGAHQVERLALDHQVNVFVGDIEQQIPHEPADQIQADTLRLRLLGNRFEQAPGRWRQRAPQPQPDRLALGFVFSCLPPLLDQVRPCHDAQQLPVVVDHRDLPPAGAHHPLLQHLDRVVGADGYRPAVHDLANRQPP